VRGPTAGLDVVKKWKTSGPWSELKSGRPDRRQLLYWLSYPV
jgi:hypothetical protein